MSRNSYMQASEIQAAGGLVPAGMALGALGIGFGALALTNALVQMLTH